MNKTKIDWCNSTWNPITGCLHGCEYCYARGIAERFQGEIAGKETVKRITIEDGRMIWDLPKAIHKTDGKISPYPCGFVPTFHRYKLDEAQKWKKGRNIFVCSMADLFGDWVPDSWIKEVFKACEKAPQHNYLFLTKNPRRYYEMYKKNKHLLPAGANMWYGFSITNNDYDAWYTDGRYTFTSIEPILQPITRVPFVDWIIIGAETGRRKDKVIPKREWIEDIVNECRKADIPVFMKSSLADIWGDLLIQEFPKELRKCGISADH